jgi:hypothetical protein
VAHRLDLIVGALRAAGVGTREGETKFPNFHRPSPA